MDQGSLQTIDTGIARRQNFKPGIAQGFFQDFRGRGPHGADQGLDVAHEFGVFGVGGIVGGEADPIEGGDLAARLDDAVDFAEEGRDILAQTEGLDLVEGVETFVGER